MAGGEERLIYCSNLNELISPIFGVEMMVSFTHTILVWFLDLTTCDYRRVTFWAAFRPLLNVLTRVDIPQGRRGTNLAAVRHMLELPFRVLRIDRHFQDAGNFADSDCSIFEDRFHDLIPIFICFARQWTFPSVQS